MTSTGPRVDSSFKPSCSCNAVKRDAPDGRAPTPTASIVTIARFRIFMTVIDDCRRPTVVSQSGVGCSTRSITTTSTGPRDDSSLSPNCSWRAVKIDGPVAVDPGRGPLIWCRALDADDDERVHWRTRRFQFQSELFFERREDRGTRGDCAESPGARRIAARRAGRTTPITVAICIGPLSRVSAIPRDRSRARPSARVQIRVSTQAVPAEP